MINLNGNIRLFINNEEYDFDGKINFSFESSNFSSLTFNNVIKKSNNVYPKTLETPSLLYPFTYAEVWVNDKVEFIGLINDLGRFKLRKDNLKTFSIKISDYRKWLTLTRPIEKIYVGKTIFEILNDQLNELNEPKIKLKEGLNKKLITIIDFYSTQSKNIYQILKEVSERQSGGILYYYVQDGILIIDYKINEDFNIISSINLDLEDEKMLTQYKVLDVEYDVGSNDYYNYLQITSENVKSFDPVIENNLSLKKSTVKLKKNLYEIDMEKSVIKDLNNNSSRQAVFKNKQTLLDGEYYDFLYQLNSDFLEVRETSSTKLLDLIYYSQDKVVLPYSKQIDVDYIKNISHTKNGVVFKTEQYNDITTWNDLSKALINLYEKYSHFQAKITLVCRDFIWDILDVVNVNNINDQVNGNYFVQSISGYLIKGENNNHFFEINYTLNNSKNLDTLLNKYNTQVYRKNPDVDPNNPSLSLVQLIQYNINYDWIIRVDEQDIPYFDTAEQNNQLLIYTVLLILVGKLKDENSFFKVKEEEEFDE